MLKRSELIPVWDRPVRLLHWALVLLVAASWFTGSQIGPQHEWLGYGVATVVGLRLLWGVVGSPYARFRQFVRGPEVTAAYLRSVLAGRAARHLGHNPLGGWMVLALLACLVALVATGWLYTTDWLWGYAWLANLHAALAWLLLGLITLHLAGVLFTSWQHRENLVRAMLSGRKRPVDSGQG